MIKFLQKFIIQMKATLILKIMSASFDIKS